MRVVAKTDNWEVNWKTACKIALLYSKIPGTRIYGLWSDKNNGLRFYFKNGVVVDILGILEPFKVK